MNLQPGDIIYPSNRCSFFQRGISQSVSALITQFSHFMEQNVNNMVSNSYNVTFETCGSTGSKKLGGGALFIPDEALKKCQQKTSSTLQLTDLHAKFNNESHCSLINTFYQDTVTRGKKQNWFSWKTAERATWTHARVSFRASSEDLNKRHSAVHWSCLITHSARHNEQPPQWTALKPRRRSIRGGGGGISVDTSDQYRVPPGTAGPPAVSPLSGITASTCVLRLAGSLQTLHRCRLYWEDAVWFRGRQRDHWKISFLITRRLTMRDQSLVGPPPVCHGWSSRRPTTSSFKLSAFYMAMHRYITVVQGHFLHQAHFSTMIQFHNMHRLQYLSTYRYNKNNWQNNGPRYNPSHKPENTFISPISLESTLTSQKDTLSRL